MKSLETALLIFFRPASAFRLIKKNRERFNYATPLILAALAAISRVLGLTITHAPFRPSEINAPQEAITVLLLIFSAAAATYLTTTITRGESLFREVLSATAYIALPYAAFNIVIAALSNVMSLTDWGIYSFLSNAVYIWVAALYIAALSVMNSYKAAETLKIAILSLFACVCLWTVTALAYMLGVKLFGFIGEVIEEYSILWFGR